MKCNKSAYAKVYADISTYLMILSWICSGRNWFSCQGASAIESRIQNAKWKRLQTICRKHLY